MSPANRSQSGGAAAGGSRSRRGSDQGSDAKAAKSKDEPFAIVYFRRHKSDDPARATPGLEFLDSVPPTVAADFDAVLDAVAKAPPHKFAGGGKWEAMHGDMSGLYEIRVDGPPKRTHYRLFCVLDTTAEGKDPMLVVLDGDSKPFRTTMPDKVYKRVRKRRGEYFARVPRAKPAPSARRK